MSDIPHHSFTAGTQYLLRLKDGTERIALCVGADAEAVHFQTDDGEIIGIDMLNPGDPGHPVGDRASGSSGPGQV
jgi:hypothetical protein